MTTTSTYGIELEMSSLSIGSAQSLLNRAGLTWAVKPDGTRGVSAEAVSPILGAETLAQCTTAARALASAGATVNKQTGYHVHLGADHYGLNGIANLVVNWAIAHDTIAALVAPSRLNNGFCRPLSLQDADRTAEQVRNGRIANINGGRYYSLNLASYDRHGTVEIRLHHGTLNGSKIKAWAEFCNAMAELSKAGILIDSADLAHDNRLNNLAGLLRGLVGNGYLTDKTATYLNGRAADLAARQQ
jgi:Putative amidoligase enzyme